MRHTLQVLGRLREDLRGTHQALRICHDCTVEHDAVGCESCEPMGSSRRWKPAATG